MADINTSINVTVKEAAREDAGRGIARVSLDAMRALGLVSGDVIEIQGKRKANAIVWPGFAEDTGRAILRIDGSTRGNAGTDWAHRFDDHAQDLLTSRPENALALLEHPDAQASVPTADHFIPLLYVAGLAADRPADVLVQGYTYGSLSMTSYTL